jgi:hypothetical protein
VTTEMNSKFVKILTKFVTLKKSGNKHECGSCIKCDIISVVTKYQL